MKLTPKALIAAAALFGIVALTGCNDQDTSASKTTGATTTQTSQPLKVGIISGYELDIAQVAKKVAKEKYNLDVELVIFNDYVMPNEALNNGDIDLNAFQHKPYLDQNIKDRGYTLVPVAKTFIYPIAGYSHKIKSLDTLKEGATITIPNDPTNSGRSLLLLQDVGLIKLREGVGLFPTVLDIIDNPKKLNIVELEAPQLPRTLDDPSVTISIINNTYASQVGLTPTKDGLFVESKDSPYVNWIVARENNKDDPRVQEFIKAYQTPEVAAKANKLFHGQALQGW